MSNKTVALIIASMIGVTFAGIGVWLSSHSSPKSPPVVTIANSRDKPTETTLPVPEKPKPQPLTIPKPKIPAFRVITEKIAYEDALRCHLQIAVFIEERVTEKKLRLLLDHLYAHAKRAGPFKFRQHPNIIDIRIHARKGQAYIAWGYESPFEEFDVEIRKKLLATVHDPPIVKFGLTEDKRQMIWRDIVRVEERARLESQVLYPFPLRKNDPNYLETSNETQITKQLDYASEMRKQYRIELAESLDLTFEQLEEIADEGIKNWWETPPFR